MKNAINNIVTLTFLSIITLNGFSQYNNAFKFRINGNGYYDETVIRLFNGATQNFDGSFDAWKLFSPNVNVPSLYTQTPIGQELSINSLPEFTEDKSITLYTNIPASGTYTLDIEEIYALTPNYKISLTDINSNTHFRILGDTSLIFTFSAQQNTPTFTFNISTPLVSTITDETCFAMNDGSIQINNAGNDNWDLLIEDASSNVVINNTVNSDLSTFVSLAPGNYSARVFSKGIEDNFNFNIAPALSLIADFNFDQDTVYISQGSTINLINLSQNTQTYSWDFNDGGTSTNINPSHTYTTIGNYDVTLTASNNNCIATKTKQLIVLTAPQVVTSVDKAKNTTIKLANFGNGNYQLSAIDGFNKNITVYDLSGRLVFSDISLENNYSLSLANQSSGIYILNVIADNGIVFQQKLHR